MTDPIRELKIRAEILQHSIDVREPTAVARLRSLAEHAKSADADLLEAAAHVQRKHCLAIVAKETGFRSWEHVLDVIDGESPTDFGELLYPKGPVAHLHHWFASYDEAKQFRGASGGYLLAYKRHFFVAEREHIATLGWDADDDDWKRIDWDWARPADRTARRRLYGKLLAPRVENRAGP